MFHIWAGEVGFLCATFVLTRTVKPPPSGVRLHWTIKYFIAFHVILYIYKWKNHFYKMKGDVGMSGHEKERK